MFSAYEVREGRRQTTRFGALSVCVRCVAVTAVLQSIGSHHEREQTLKALGAETEQRIVPCRSFVTESLGIERHGNDSDSTCTSAACPVYGCSVGGPCIHVMFGHGRCIVVPLMLQVAGVFTNLFGGVAGSKYGLQCTLLSSLFLQVRGQALGVRPISRLFGVWCAVIPFLSSPLLSTEIENRLDPGPSKTPCSLNEV